MRMNPKAPYFSSLYPSRKGIDEFSSFASPASKRSVWRQWKRATPAQLFRAQVMLLAVRDRGTRLQMSRVFEPNGSRQSLVSHPKRDVARVLQDSFRVGDGSWSEEGISMPPTKGRANAQSAAIVQKARMPSHPYK